MNSVKERLETVIGHVIQSKVNGTNRSDEDFSYELERLAHKFALEIMSILQAYFTCYFRRRYDRFEIRIR